MAETVTGIMDSMQTLLKEFYDSCGAKVPTTTYRVVITETLRKEVEIELPVGSYYEALNRVKEAYNNSEIVLSADDHVDTEFDVDFDD